MLTKDGHKIWMEIEDKFDELKDGYNRDVYKLPAYQKVARQKWIKVEDAREAVEGLNLFIKNVHEKHFPVCKSVHFKACSVLILKVVNKYIKKHFQAIEPFSVEKASPKKDEVKEK